MEVDGHGLPLFSRGEVRDSFDVGHHLLMVATDRVAVGGVPLADGIPDKGKLINEISLYWFRKTTELCPNHLADDVAWPRALEHDRDELEPRSLLVHKATTIPVECTARGYMTDSAFREYLLHGTVGLEPVRSGVLRSGHLPETMVAFTAREGTGSSTKREPLPESAVRDRFGAEVATRITEAALGLYRFAHDHARPLDIIIAEATFEFGWVEGEFCLIGDCVTPDTATFWPSEAHLPGLSPVRMGREFVEEWLTAMGWSPPAAPPRLPESVMLGVRERYLESYGRLAGHGRHLGKYAGWYWNSALGNSPA